MLLPHSNWSSHWSICTASITFNGFAVFLSPYCPIFNLLSPLLPHTRLNPPHPHPNPLAFLRKYLIGRINPVGIRHAVFFKFLLAQANCRKAGSSRMWFSVWKMTGMKRVAMVGLQNINAGGKIPKGGINPHLKRHRLAEHGYIKESNTWPPYWIFWRGSKDDHWGWFLH